MLSSAIAPFKSQSVAARYWRVIEPVVDFCYPRQCAACALKFEPICERSPAILCASCAAELEQIATAPSCPRCAMPAPVAGGPCPHCFGRGLTPFDRVVTLGVLRDPLRRLIHRTKYARRWPLAGMLVDRAMQRSDLRDLLAETDLIVPVPLYRWRQFTRGFNQAELIARSLARAAGKRCKNVALRLHATSVQAQLHSRTRRYQNLRDAFVLERPAPLAGKRVLVVDDVLTSGATLVALGRALTAAQPAKLSAFVLAVADPKGRSFEVI